MMASPLNISPWPGVTEPSSVSDAEQGLQTQNISDSDLILTRLREQIAAGNLELDNVLGTIAIAAQAMTDATGAALGMRRDGTVVCVGRSGETAPALGARLSESSGISGECLRNGRNQRCDDTEIDLRVDAEVCRHLGLRSIAAVPVRSRLETVGILEVFSTSDHAFTDEHMARLASLAELADAASPTAASDVQPIEVITSAGTDLGPRPDLPILGSSWTHEEHRKRIWPYLAVASGVVVLGLLSVASWRMWGELKSRDVAQPIASQPQDTTPTHTEAQTPVPAQPVQSKPMPEQMASTASSTNPAQKNRVVQASNVESEPDDGLIRNIPSEPAAAVKTGTSAKSKAAEDDTANTPPQVAMVTTPDDSLHGIMAHETTLPKLSQPTFQGVTPLVLEHKVIPTYPHQAMAIRREGSVVMRATVTDDGRVASVKMLSGDLILGKAAMDAVRQWRYHPALLNGKPTQTETDITLNFRLP